MRVCSLCRECGTSSFTARRVLSGDTTQSAWRVYAKYSGPMTSTCWPARTYRRNHHFLVVMFEALWLSVLEV